MIDSKLFPKALSGFFSDMRKNNSVDKIYCLNHIVEMSLNISKSNRRRSLMCN